MSEEVNNHLGATETCGFLGCSSRGWKQQVWGWRDKFSRWFCHRWSGPHFGNKITSWGLFPLATSLSHLHGLLHIFAWLLWFQIKPVFAPILFSAWSWGKLLPSPPHPLALPSSSELESFCGPNSQAQMKDYLKVISCACEWLWELALSFFPKILPCDTKLVFSSCLQTRYRGLR